MLKNFIKVGTITLGDHCDVTDPCYKKDVWCRTTMPVRPGKYNCFMLLDKKNGRVKRSMIVHESVKTDMFYQDYFQIGVDAGLAGYFNNKPDYTDKEWQEFCDKIGTASYLIEDDMFVTSTGWGDGGYPLRICLDGGDVVAATIEFI